MKIFYACLFLYLFFCPLCRSQHRGNSLTNNYNNRTKWEKDLKRIIDSAYVYRFHPQNSQGVHSYIGFTIPKGFDSTELGTYSIYKIFPDKLIIQANLPFNKFPLFCIVDSIGNCRTRLRGSEYELDKLGELAYKYRNEPVSEGGGGGSYVGFKIPKIYELTESGWYTIKDIKPDEITLQVNHLNERYVRTATFKADGQKRKPGDYHIDLNKIKSLAYKYRSCPISEGGGGGSYVGFRIPDDLDTTMNGEYFLKNVQPDEFVIGAHLKGRAHKYLVVIDSTGNEMPNDFKRHGDFEEFNKNEIAIFNDIKNISKEAIGYWNNSKITKDMHGSFEGYTISPLLSYTKNGTYSIIEFNNDTIYVKAVSSIGSGTKYFRIDYKGHYYGFVFGEYRPKKTALKGGHEYLLKKFENADYKLNEVYQKLTKLLNSDKSFISNLRKSERLWIKFRDTRLKEKFPEINPSMVRGKFTESQLIYLIVLTEERIKELMDLLEERIND